MAIKVNYTAILKKLKDVATIDIEDVYFVVRTETPCSTCAADPSFGATNFLCATCGGRGVTISDAQQLIETSVDYVDGTENMFALSSTIQRGDILLTVHVDKLTGIGLTPIDFLDQPYPVKFIIINGKKYIIVSVTPGKLNGTLYELQMQLTLPTKEQSIL